MVAIRFITTAWRPSKVVNKLQRLNLRFVDRVIFCRGFLLLMDVNEWINDEFAECAVRHLNHRLPYRVHLYRFLRKLYSPWFAVTQQVPQTEADTALNEPTFRIFQGGGCLSGLRHLLRDEYSLAKNNWEMDFIEVFSGSAEKLSTHSANTLLIHSFTFVSKWENSQT